MASQQSDGIFYDCATLTTDRSAIPWWSVLSHWCVTVTIAEYTVVYPEILQIKREYREDRVDHCPNPAITEFSQ